MTVAILSRFVINQGLLQDRDFLYQSAKHLQGDPQTESRTYVCLDASPGTPKAFFYFQDSSTREWRRGGDHPLRTRRWLSVMAVATLVLFTLKVVFRTIQAVIILTGVFFRAYKGTFSCRKEDEFSDIFIESLKAQIYDQKGKLQIIGKNLALDTKCSVVMIVSGVAANFYSDERKIRMMEVVFSEAERTWNQGPDFDRAALNDDDWDAKKTVVANWARFFRNLPRERASFQQVFQESSNLWEDSNGAFYLYECAQPLTARSLERVEWNTGDQQYQSYEAILQAQRAVAANLSSGL